MNAVRDAEPRREAGEDRVVVARFADRRDRLLHRDMLRSPTALPMSSRSSIVVAGKHDVGEFRLRRPVLLMDDHRLGPLPGAHELVDVLVVVERIAARPVDQADIGIAQALPVIGESAPGSSSMSAMRATGMKSRTLLCPCGRRGPEKGGRSLPRLFMQE